MPPSAIAKLTCCHQFLNPTEKTRVRGWSFEAILWMECFLHWVHIANSKGRSSGHITGCDPVSGPHFYVIQLKSNEISGSRAASNLRHVGEEYIRVTPFGLQNRVQDSRFLIIRCLRFVLFHETQISSWFIFRQNHSPFSVILTGLSHKSGALSCHRMIGIHSFSRLFQQMPIKSWRESSSSEKVTGIRGGISRSAKQMHHLWITHRFSSRFKVNVRFHGEHDLIIYWSNKSSFCLSHFVCASLLLHPTQCYHETLMSGWDILDLRRSNIDSTSYFPGGEYLSSSPQMWMVLLAKIVRNKWLSVSIGCSVILQHFNREMR
jgi:hypothetical protein